MKLRLEASPDELQHKSGKLVTALSDLFRSVAPDLSEALEKALPPKEQELKYAVLRALQKRTQELYQQHLDAMLQEIGKVLGQETKKSLEYDHTKPIAEKDDVAYKRVKEVLIRMGWAAADFEAGGPLFGWSVNQLLELAKQRRRG